MIVYRNGVAIAADADLTAQINSDWMANEALAAARVPDSVSVRQARVVLGPDVCAALDAMAADPDTPWALRQTLLYAGRWDRTAPEIDEIGWALGYDAQQIDALFRAAAAV